MSMDRFFLQSLYDEGNFPASPGRSIIFSKPFWRHLIHKTRTPQDRVAILTKKQFAITNPVLLPAVFARPDKWMEPQEIAADPDKTIKITTYYNAKFAHNGANRPIDALRGVGSGWWNYLYCAALNELGAGVTPSGTPEDYDWVEANKSVIEALVTDFDARPAFMAVLNRKLREAGVDILGSGGEFMILDQSVINWDFTREASGGFKTRGQKQAAKRKEANEDAIKAVEDAIRPFSEESFTLPIMSLYKTFTSKRALVITDFFTRSENVAGDFVGAICAAADAHGVILAMPTDTQIASSDRHDKQMVRSFLARNGFTHEKGEYLFRQPVASK